MSSSVIFDAHSTMAGKGRSLRRSALITTLPFTALLLAGLPATQAAGVNPLPAVAMALTTVKSYQVVVTTTSSGTPFRPSGTGSSGARPTPPPGTNRGTRRGGGLGFFGAGKQTRTIVAVRKGSLFEDYVVSHGLTQAGKSATSSIVMYGNNLCTPASSGHAYTCRTSSFSFTIDPTAAFAQGAGSTTFTHSGSKTIGGQSCVGYAYLNQSQTSTAKGVVYIASKTNLPCEQDATVTRKGPNGAAFTQTSISVWSRFNDKSLSVPAIPVHQ